MKTPKITVVGSFAVGMTIRASKLPIFGETMLGTDFDMGPGGKGSNQAVATARLGARSSLLAMVGADKLASIGTDLYAAEGVDASLVTPRPERPTGVGFIILNAKGENFIILDMGANELLDADAVDAGGSADRRQRRRDDGARSADAAAAQRAMELGRKHGATTILNPAPARALPASIFESVDYLTPNESELRILLDLPADDPRSSQELAEELRRRGVRNVITTLGRDGAMILTDTLNVRVPAIEVEVTDTTGAGDAFNSGFAVALAEGRDLVEAVRFGVACGGIACTRLGVIPSLPHRARADAAYEDGIEDCLEERQVNRNRLLNAELSHAIASMGHGDLMIVCDAGFPIPSTAWRIDLAIVPDVPDLETVLTAISQNLIAERVGYAEDVPEYNAPLLAKIKRLFPDADYEPVKHAAILSEMAYKAKAIVRTGAFDPWGNILLYSGVDVPAWFSKPGVVAPDYYAKKLKS